MSALNHFHVSRNRHFRAPALIAAIVVVGSLAAAGPVAAEEMGDAVAGEKIFKKCKACHKIGDGAKNSVGPVLTGVLGRPAGTVEGYRYGKGMKAAREKGLVWDTELVFAYLADPKKFLREFTGDKRAKAKMVFKLKDEDDRRNVIAYLQSFSEPRTN